MSRKQSLLVGTVCVAFLLGAPAASAQLAMDPAFQTYTLADLGAPPGVPLPFGGVTFKYDDPDMLLIGGSAGSTSGQIYAIKVTRNVTKHITGFQGTAVALSTAPRIDGGLSYGPNNVLFFTTWNDNMLGQIKPGSATPDKMIDLTALGVMVSVGGLAFTPSGLAGAGHLKLTSFNVSNWYDAQVVPDGLGTFDLQNVAHKAFLSGGTEAIAYVPAGNPGFVNDSVLVCEWNTAQIATYDIDANGDPIPATRRTFVASLATLSEGALGNVIDPKASDLVFSTNSFGAGTDRIVVVSGFTKVNTPTTSFCTAKTGLVCGTPAISAVGLSSVAAASGFTVSAGPARSNRSGILLYNQQKAAGPLPFQGGTLCVEAMGLRRAGSTNSGGSGGGGAGPCTANPTTCDGLFTIDMNAFAQGSAGLCAPSPCWVVPDCAGNPAGIAPNNPAAYLLAMGTTIHCQYWGRDSTTTGSFVSDGLSWTIGP